MDTLGIIFTVILVVALLLVGLYFLGNKLQKKQAESQTMIQQNRQTISAMVIDKKKMKLTESNLPKQAIEGVPFYLKIRKMPMVKVKIGPQFMTMLCDPKVYEVLPVKRVLKLEISGAYILGFSTAKKGEKYVAPPRKLTLREKLQNKLNKVQEDSEPTKKKQQPDGKQAVEAAKKAARDQQRMYTGGAKRSKKNR
ncbi:MAG: hypothetical protein IJ917_01220 [Firmicutes bacterium]|nr:hypothetical protein [Bacillota bacterium]